MNTKRILILSALAVAPFTSSALTYNEKVNQAGPAPAPGSNNEQGIYYGDGNSNGGFAVDRDATTGIELGLRAHTRYPVATDTGINAPAGIYSFNDGVFTPPDQPANRASWNYDFSINSGTGPLSSYQFEISIDSDPSLGVSWNPFNPLDLPNDNEPTGDSFIAQNSWNALFAEGVPGYDKTIAGSYDIMLSAYDGATLLAQTRIRVDVNGGGSPVPDAGSTGLLSLLGCAGVFVGRRFRR